MICVSLHHKSFEEILALLEQDGAVEMAEIRLDSCPLDDDQIRSLFENADVPLIATCRAQGDDWARTEQRLGLAIEAGARFADLEVEAPVTVSKHIRQLCQRHGTELIRSWHDFSGTPDADYLLQITERCYRYGADIAKIVTTATDAADCTRVLDLYGQTMSSGLEIEPWRLTAFCMGEAGRDSRLECLRAGAPFTYAALDGEAGSAPGQWPLGEMRQAVYGDRKDFHADEIQVNASKSFAQRAIIAAALAEGTSHLRGYTPCADNEAAIAVARTLGARVEVGPTLTITGIGPVREPLHLEKVDTGESGLLTRLMIPLLCVINEGPVRIEGHGTLLNRPLKGATDIMASFGVLLKQQKVPLTVCGPLIPGTADVSGRDGSQLISGLLAALPLCGRDSSLYVSEPKSIPYMYITLDVLGKFGVRIGSEMQGDAQLLEQQDWSGCESLHFKIRGGQTLRAADFDIEGDWSSAANFLVAGAVFGRAQIRGLDLSSLQADLSIIDLLVEAGASVSQTEDGVVCVRKAPLEGFETDLNNAPDLFPIVAVLAIFCAGESRIGGIGRLATKESNRAEAVTQMLTRLGVENDIEGDELVVRGETLSSRLLGGRLLEGGEFTSRHDHRMMMALKVASLATKSPVIIDDEACVGKSFPQFNELFYSAL